MTRLKHTGIYVYDLDIMTEFYKKVFDLYVIGEREKDRGGFLAELTGKQACEITVTKLITETGKQSGFGDMIELIQKNENIGAHRGRESFMECGTMHIAFGVDDIHMICNKIMRLDGKIVVQPFMRENGNWLCFAKDPENNWLELIQNKE